MRFSLSNSGQISIRTFTTKPALSTPLPASKSLVFRHLRVTIIMTVILNKRLFPAFQVREFRKHDHNVFDKSMFVWQTSSGESRNGIRPIRKRSVCLPHTQVTNVRVHDQFHTQAQAFAREVHDELCAGKFHYSTGMFVAFICSIRSRSLSLNRRLTIIFLFFPPHPVRISPPGGYQPRDSRDFTLYRVCL